jgi:SAM-dependent methyltransferase
VAVVWVAVFCAAKHGPSEDQIMKRLSDAYGDDLAYIHNVGYDFHARGLAPALLKLFKEARLAGSIVVDVGCGGGIWAQQLAKAGYRPVGIDISPAMIALARQLVPSGEFHVASFLDFALPPCGAITALGEVVCYLFDRRNQHRALARWLKRAYEALLPGGLLVFDITEIGLDRKAPSGWRSGDDWACGVWREYDERRSQLISHITTFRQVGDTYRRGEETHRIQLYDGRDVANMLKDAGFRVRSTRRFGDYKLLPKRTAFIARK